MRRLVLLTLLAVATSGCSDISPAVPGDSSAPAEATTNIADAFVDTQTTDQSPTPGPDVIDQDETASTPVNDVLEDAGSDAVGQADSVVPPQGDDGSEIINEDVTEPTDVVVDTSAPPADVAIDSNSDTLPGDGHTADTVIVDATIEDSMMPDSSSENEVPQDITLMDVMPPSDTSRDTPFNTKIT